VLEYKKERQVLYQKKQ